MKAVDRVAAATAVLFSLAVYGVILLFPGQIIGLFISTDARVLAIGVPAVMLYFLSLPFTGANTILMYYFQSIEQSLCTTGRRPAARHRARLPGAAGLLRAVGAQRRVARAFRGGGAHLRDLLPRQLRLNRGFRETDDGRSNLCEVDDMKKLVFCLCVFLLLSGCARPMSMDTVGKEPNFAGVVEEAREGSILVRVNEDEEVCRTQRSSVSVSLDAALGTA